MADQHQFDVRQIFQACNPSKFTICVCLLLESIVLSVRLDDIITSSYWLVFLPLWIWKVIMVAGAVSGLVVFYRHPDARYELDLRKDVQAMSIAAGLQLFLFIFELLVVIRLEHVPSLPWRSVFIPLYMLVVAGVLSCVFACRNKRDIEFEVVATVNLLLIIFVSLRLDNVLQWQWKIVFIPLWLFVIFGFVLVLYYVLLMMLILKKKMQVPDNEFCAKVTDGFVSLAIAVPLLAFVILLVERLDGRIDTLYSAIFVPLDLCLLAACVSCLYSRGGNQWWFGIRMDFCSFLLKHCSLLQEYGNISYRKPNEDDLEAARQLAEIQQQEQASAATTATSEPVATVKQLAIGLPD